ncbi:MAG: hypothetical protein RSA86_03000 [Christensenellaceae bacterium]
MKKNIKTVVLLMVCVILSVAMVACGSPAPSAEAPAADAEQNGAASAEGRWNIASVTTDGETMSGEDIIAQAGEMYYDLQSGGKLILGAGSQTAEGTWEQNGAEVKLDASGASYVGIIDGDTLTIEADGAISVFARA